MVAQVKQASYSMNGLDFGGIIAPRQGIRIMVPYNAERQAVRIAPTSGSAFDVAGTFKLTFGGRDTAPIRFNASAAEVRQALVDTMHTRCDYPNDDSPSQRMYVGRGVGRCGKALTRWAMPQRMPASTWTSLRTQWSGTPAAVCSLSNPWARHTVAGMAWKPLTWVVGTGRAPTTWR